MKEREKEEKERLDYTKSQERKRWDPDKQKEVIVSSAHGIQPDTAGNPRSKHVDLFGCKRCPWKGTPDCEHQVGLVFESGSEIKAHANGICIKRKNYVKSLADNIHKVTDLKVVQHEELFKDLEVSQKLMALADKGEIDFSDALPWRKHAHDVAHKIVKQEEGTKLNVSNQTISPSQFQKMVSGIDEDKIIEAEYENIEELEKEETVNEVKKEHKDETEDSEEIIEEIKSSVVKEKILISGVPKAGKTTLSEEFKDGEVFHTDDLIDDYGWSELSAEVSTWFDKPYYVIEGVAVPRALRKWLQSNKEGKPCDKLIWLSESKINVSKGQNAMGKGCIKVMDEIEAELRSRGVEIELR